MSAGPLGGATTRLVPIRPSPVKTISCQKVETTTLLGDDHVPITPNGVKRKYEDDSESDENSRKRINTTQLDYLCSSPNVSISRRNARERNRVKEVNNGFTVLRQHIPGAATTKKISKVDTLKQAVEYIQNLQVLLEENDKALEQSKDIFTYSPSPSVSQSSTSSPFYFPPVPRNENTCPCSCSSKRLPQSRYMHSDENPDGMANYLKNNPSSVDIESNLSNYFMNSDRNRQTSSHLQDVNNDKVYKSSEIIYRDKYSSQVSSDSEDRKIIESIRDQLMYSDRLKPQINIPNFPESSTHPEASPSKAMIATGIPTLPEVSIGNELPFLDAACIESVTEAAESQSQTISFPNENPMSYPVSSHDLFTKLGNNPVSSEEAACSAVPYDDLSADQDASAMIDNILTHDDLDKVYETLASSGIISEDLLKSLDF